MTADLTIGSRKKLNNGVVMPLLGLGVWQVPAGRTGVRVVLDALEAGYRHIDTAAFYGNEQSVGEAIRSSGLDRSEVFVTTKVWNTDHGYKAALAAAEAGLRRLGFDYVDLYLIHWPVEGLRLETWKALEKLSADGKARAIGVSNYMVSHLEELSAASDTPPALNQIELHPFNFLYRREVVEYCEARGIAVEAYCPLARGEKLDDPSLGRLAAACGKTPAQIMIRWSLQHGFVVIPKSVHRERIFANADVFDFAISEEDMAVIDSLNENLITTWDPSDAP